MKAIFKNWKTTLMGVATILGGVATFASGNHEGGITAIVAGIGLIVSHDATNPQ